MEFSLEKSLEILERTPTALNELLNGLNEEWIHQNEGPETWSPFDVVGHLIHGEQTDWLVRTKIILRDEDKHFVPFDRFAQFEESKGKTISELLKQFAKLRKSNLAELKSLNLSRSDFSKTGIHPELGEVTLRQLLSCWVAHDLGHIHQITRVIAKNYSEEVGPWKKYLKVVN